MKEKVTQIKRNYVFLLFETIYKWLVERRLIRKQYITEYREVCINLLMDNVAEKEGVIVELEDFYYRLQTYAGDFIDSEDKKQAFCLGEMISVYETYKQHADVLHQVKKESELVSRYKNQRIRKVLVYIALSPNGIRHKDLADKCRMSSSQLSQIQSRLRDDKTFYAVQRGREKYYILTSLGMDIYHKVCLSEATAKTAEEMEFDQRLYRKTHLDELLENDNSYYQDFLNHQNQTRKEKINRVSAGSNEEWMYCLTEQGMLAASERKLKKAALGC